MFDIATVLIIGGATIFFGKKDIILMTRFFGRGLGVLVGTIQGTRQKFEEHSKNSELGQLRDSIKHGIRGIGSISTDILYSGGRPAFKPLGSSQSPNLQQVSSPPPQPQNAHSETLANQQFQHINVNMFNDCNFHEMERMSRLILANDELQKKYKTYSNDEGSGASIVQSAISTSILNNYYALSLQSTKPNDHKPVSSESK